MSENQAEEFLELLTGDWLLTGRMGNTPLQQAVNARWVLARRFVEMQFISTLPPADDQPLYEALYFIGYDAAADLYVMHLLDTFGAGYSRTLGTGRREGDDIPFVFPYPDGPFTNRFCWDAASSTWSFVQSYEKEGQTHVFASKQMRQTHEH